MHIQYKVHYQDIFHSEFNDKFDIIDVHGFFLGTLLKLKKVNL